MQRVDTYWESARTCLQTAVLMLFNDEETLSFADIKAALSVEDRELRRTLQSLACGKVRKLLPSPVT